jgi:hypothetical protein
MGLVTLAHPDADTEAALLLAQAGEPSLWPFLLLSAASPVLLRAGGGGVFVGGLFHAMTPSQTLETGIPVNGLLAGLVLSWFSPLEAALSHTRELMQSGNLLLMGLIAPPALATTLALLLYALRRRTTLISVAVLTFIVTVRQQTLVSHSVGRQQQLQHLSHASISSSTTTITAVPLLLDALALSLAAVGMLLAVWLVCWSDRLLLLPSSSGGRLEKDQGAPL